MTYTAVQSPAQRLLGHDLAGGWIVVEKLSTGENNSGGWFSVSYKVERKDGSQGFLKALDYTKSLRAGADPLRHIQALLTSFNFERDLLRQCGAQGMSRVVRAVDEGWVNVDPSLPFGVGRVEYLIFEWAEHGDVRAHRKLMEEFDAAWALRCLHCTAVGMSQLHGRGIAHQDLNQTNVLVFHQTLAKVGDLGRAVVRGQAGPSDDYVIAGDRRYAPPELLYGAGPGDWQRYRLGCDLYQLGSLTLFLFTGLSANAHLFSRLDPALHFSNYKGSFEEVLPLLEDAFSRLLVELGDAPSFSEKLRGDLVKIARYLNHPDPGERGHPQNRRGHRDPYSLAQFVSWFERLARDAERGLVPRHR